MSAIFDYEQWIEIVERGTSGDQVDDILGDFLLQECKSLETKLEIAVEGLKASRRCYQFLVALYKEIDQMKYTEKDEKALLMAQMKINLFGYLSQIWSNGKLLINDKATIENALAEIERLSINAEKLAKSKR
jgi:hypothetical protein